MDQGDQGTMELGVGPGALWSHFYILLMYGYFVESEAIVCGVSLSSSLEEH